MNEAKHNGIELKIGSLPERKPQGGRPAKGNREMRNAMVYWLNTGVPWRDLLKRFGSWQSRGLEEALEAHYTGKPLNRC